MTDYATYQPSLHPTALAGPYGLSWGRSQGTMKDRVITLATDALDAGLVLRCPDDALPLLAADVALERLPLDDADTYRARIQGAWETWRWAGTRTALALVFAALNPSGSTRLATAHELARSPWAQWWAFLSQPDPMARRVWGAPGTWGVGIWGAQNPTLGATNSDRALVRTVRRLARRFSNARDRGWVVTLQSSPGVWGAPAVWGAPGVWGARNLRWRI